MRFPARCRLGVETSSQPASYACWDRTMGVRLCCLSIPLSLWTAFTAAGAETKISFTRQIKPILANKCFACHGPDEKERKAELRLDVRDEAVPSVIKPGDSVH